jgi:chaperonin GroES
LELTVPQSAIKTIKSLAPLLDRVLVQRLKPDAKTATGIFLPETAVKELNEAKVLAVGPGAYDKEGKRVAVSVQPGDKVLIPQVGQESRMEMWRYGSILTPWQFGGSPIKVGEDEYSLFRDYELLAKINE